MRSSKQQPSFPLFPYFTVSLVLSSIEPVAYVTGRSQIGNKQQTITGNTIQRGVGSTAPDCLSVLKPHWSPLTLKG